MNPYTAHLMTLFDGNRDAYGKFTYESKTREDGKVKGKGITIRGPVNPSLWEDHLEGKEQLGIIPITQDSTTKFGAIDIDDYRVDKEAIIQKIHKHSLPVTAFRSKSGGLHLYLFVTEHVESALMQKKLREIASFVGYGQAEIFPKQTTILKERGDIGQWINMPYFDINNPTRYAYRTSDAFKLNIKMFCQYIFTQVITPKQLIEFTCPLALELPNGPPCLQHLVTQGFPEGTRNLGLFNLGVYAQKVNKDDWRRLIEEFNIQYVKPPLSPGEVLTVIQSLSKKEYNYKCKDAPICSHCNIALCRQRKYGVGEISGMPTLGTLTKLDCEPPIWFIDVDGGGRIELDTDSLQNPLKFQRRCLEVLNVMPVLPSRKDWQTVIQNLLENLTVIPVPRTSTPAGQLMQFLEEFCTNKGGNETSECILRGLVYNCEGFHHFRMSDFLAYLDRKRFYDFKVGKIASIFADNKAESKHMTVMGKTVSIYRIPIFRIEVQEFTPPTVDGPVPF